VARLFVPDPEVSAEAATFFRVVPLSSFFFGLVMVFMAAFRGSGHTWPDMVVSVVRWVLRLGGAVLLAFVLGMGSLGIYVAMAGGNMVVSVLAFCWFLFGRWDRAVVPAKGEEQSGVGKGSSNT
jgi:Na+-driven multidrug efflux pump